MGELRKEWQQWKAAHPAFDKIKADKLNLGPMMDDFEAKCDSIAKDLGKLEKILFECYATRTRIRDGYYEYKKALPALKSTYPDIEADFIDAFHYVRDGELARFLTKDFPRAVRF